MNITITYTPEEQAELGAESAIREVNNIDYVTMVCVGKSAEEDGCAGFHLSSHVGGTLDNVQKAMELVQKLDAISADLSSDIMEKLTGMPGLHGKVMMVGADGLAKVLSQILGQSAADEAPSDIDELEERKRQGYGKGNIRNN